MKVYVSELPKSCESCPFYLKNHCVIDNISFHCPLEEGTIKVLSLAEHDKQVRKETIDDLAVGMMMHLSKDAEFTVEEICNWLQKVKDQIETE